MAIGHGGYLVIIIIISIIGIFDANIFFGNIYTHARTSHTRPTRWRNFARRHILSVFISIFRPDCVVSALAIDRPTGRD